MGKKRILFTKEEWINFTVNFLAIVLGIVITFIGEDLISRHRQKVRVNETLELVKGELSDGLEVIRQFNAIFGREHAAASYIWNFRNRLNEADKDSLKIYGGQLFYYQQLNIDMLALDLIKRDDFIQGLDDYTMTICIQQAYLEQNGYAAAYNTYFTEKKRLMDEIMNADVKKVITDDTKDMSDVIKQIMSDARGKYFVNYLTIASLSDFLAPTQASSTAAIEAIDTRLKK